MANEEKVVGPEKSPLEKELESLRHGIAHLMAANQEMIDVIKALGAVFGAKLVAQKLPGGKMRLQWVKDQRIVLAGGRG